MINFGDVPANSVLPVHFGSYNAAGASVTLSGLAITDVEIYKGITVTQRSSDNGVVLIDTDGIDLDGTVGVNGFSIDLSDNTDAGFYAVGSYYNVWVASVTIDGQTVNFLAATFRIVAAEHTSGYVVATIKDGTGTGEIDTTSGGVLVAAIAANAITAAAIANAAIDAATFAAGAIDAAALAADAGTEIGTAVWATAARTLTAGTNIVLAKGTGVTGFTDLSAADVRTAVGLASADLDSQLDNLDFQLGLIGNDLSSINGTLTTNLDAPVSAVPAAILAADFETDGEAGVSVAEGLRVTTAALAGKLSGAGTGTETVRSFLDAKDRLVYAVDTDGNRSAVTPDLT